MAAPVCTNCNNDLKSVLAVHLLVKMRSSRRTNANDKQANSCYLFSMTLRSAIGGMFLALSFVIGSIVGIASATEKAFATPCPMHDQGDHGPCCKGDCSGAMLGCSVKSSVPFAMAQPQQGQSLNLKRLLPGIVWTCDGYDPFVARPPPPIPIV